PLHRLKVATESVYHLRQLESEQVPMRGRDTPELLETFRQENPCAVEYTHVRFEQRRGDLNQTLEDERGRRIALGGCPQALPCFVRLPEIEGVEQIDTIEPVVEGAPLFDTPRRVAVECGMRFV